MSWNRNSSMRRFVWVFGEGARWRTFLSPQHMRTTKERKRTVRLHGDLLLISFATSSQLYCAFTITSTRKATTLTWNGGRTGANCNRTGLHERAVNKWIDIPQLEKLQPILNFLKFTNLSTYFYDEIQFNFNKWVYKKKFLFLK